jgi:hypothetical protein
MVSRVASRVVIGTPGLFGIDQMSRDRASLESSGPMRTSIVVYRKNIRIDPDKRRQAALFPQPILVPLFHRLRLALEEDLLVLIG